MQKKNNNMKKIVFFSSLCFILISVFSCNRKNTAVNQSNDTIKLDSVKTEYVEKDSMYPIDTLVLNIKCGADSI